MTQEEFIDLLDFRIRERYRETGIEPTVIIYHPSKDDCLFGHRGATVLSTFPKLVRNVYKGIMMLRSLDVDRDEIVVR